MPGPGGNAFEGGLVVPAPFPLAWIWRTDLVHVTALLAATIAPCQGGELGALDFRMGGIGAPVNGLKAFATTGQLGIFDKLANALALGTSPIVKALVNFDAAMVSNREGHAA